MGSSSEREGPEAKSKMIVFGVGRGPCEEPHAARASLLHCQWSPRKEGQCWVQLCLLEEGHDPVGSGYLHRPHLPGGGGADLGQKSKI